MKTIYFSLIIALCVAFIRADGTAYEATWYGGSNDHHREMNPSCTGEKYPDTDYYAAVSSTYAKDLCNNYAVVMAVDNKDSEYLGKMVKVKIVDSCRECERSHIDVSEKAFNNIRKKGDGHFPIVWVAAKSNGSVTRDIVYPSSKTESFAKKYFGLSKSQFISMYKKQALYMITHGVTHSKFNKNDVPVTTTTKKTTTVKPTTTKAPVTTTAVQAQITSEPIVTVANNTSEENTVPSIAGLGDINIITGESDDNSIPDDAPIVGQSKVVDPNQTTYSEEDIKVLESQFPDKEEDNNSYTVGVLSGVLTVSGAAGIGLIYLKKQSPGKYDELRQRFPEAFDNIKRSVSRSATQLKRSVTRSSKKNETRHADHPEVNYRDMPDYMFGSDGLPRIELHDLPSEPLDSSFPEAKLEIK
ncbi:hypothetical protein BCR36DRAFT_102427 [Piromyces finnis]|uniref:RlpA-like protein double-psi beta-barrel domain-containing protein n=1 Tax=Piromyces finnis TaxID=1754191 RepID=A0A1Y1V3A7_9FUNG|nr:hypothetical protein BCR36DRAFT_102427 [Piromyces finnis]|eukprot:ORX46368.1 hypothetical protein BCR36DRAFT_102427 [Piromyces finnis]